MPVLATLTGRGLRPKASERCDRYPAVLHQWLRQLAAHAYTTKFLTGCRSSKAERTHKGSPARERVADRAVKRESTTEATHPAVGEKRQVGVAL